MGKLARIKVDKSTLILVGILLLAAGLRFYRLPEMVNYDFDQQFAAEFAYEVVKIYPIRMIGQGLSVQGLFMGPWYFYYLVPFFMLTGLHPLGGYVGSVFLGLTTILAYYWVTKAFFSKQAGLIAAWLSAISFSAMETDWSLTPAFSSGLAVLVTWWLLYKYWQGKVNWLPALGLIFGLYTSFHPILFPFYLVFAVLLLMRRKLPKIKMVLVSGMAFILPVIPWLMFDYFRKWEMLKILLKMFTSRGTGQRQMGEMLLANLKNMADNVPRILAINATAPGLAAGIVLLIWGYLTLKQDVKNRDFHLTLFPLVIGVWAVYYALFPTHVPEYYLGAIGTLILLYITQILGQMSKKAWGKILLVVILVNVSWVNLNQLKGQKWNNQSLITLAHKDAVVKEIVKREGPGDKFFVSYISNPGWNFGFDYLFKHYERIPQKDAVKDHIYTIVIPKSLSPESIDIDSGNVGLILPDQFKSL